jgi:hypothetical protein
MLQIQAIGQSIFETGAAGEHFAALATQIEAEAQIKAEGRAAELFAEQENQRAIAAFEASLLQVRAEEAAKWSKQMMANNFAYTKTTVSGFQSMFSNLSKLQESHSKTAQRIGRVAAKAKIVTDTASAAMGAYSAMAGIPIIGPALGIAAAAAAIAAGAVQMANVDKGSVSPGGGPADTSTGNEGGIATPKAPGQTLVLQGESFSAESLVRLFDEARERGMTIEGVRRG